MDAQALSLSPTFGLLALGSDGLGTAVPMELPAAFHRGSAGVFLPTRLRSAGSA